MYKNKIEKIGILLLIYLLPYRDFPLVMREPVSIRLFDIGIFAYIFFTFTFFAVNRSSYKLNFKISILVGFVIFEIWMCLISFIGLISDGSHSIIIRDLILVPFSFLIYFIAYNEALRSEVSWFTRHMIISLLIANITAYIFIYLFPELALTWSAGIDLDDKGFSIKRFAGFGSEPNYWGNLFLFLLPVSIAGIFSKSIRHELRLNQIVLFIFLSFAVLSFSTFTHIAIILSFVSILLMKFNNINKFKMICVLLLFIFIIVLIGSNYIVYMFTKIATVSTSSSFERFYWAYSAVKMWLESPIIVGRGLGTYVNYYQDYIPYDVSLPIAEQANSVFFATLAEQGIVGLGLLVMMLITIIGVYPRNILNIYRNNFFLKLLFVGILLYLPYFLITGTLYLYYFWFYAGSLVGFSQRETSKLYKNEPLAKPYSGN